MPEYIDTAVERVRESFSEAPVTLLLGVGGEPDTVVTPVERTGATVESTLGRVTLRVTAPTSAIDGLIDLDEITSIELERDDVRPLDEGNQHSRRRVTR
jgi:hypothetical protein